jgi:molybdopterin/thiamine biosynthesis adenylyltransferase
MTKPPAGDRWSLSTQHRYSRQDLVWPHERLARATVLVVGAGAIGNEVVKNLTLLGVGRIAVVDMDVVAPSNLTRCVLFRDQDVGSRKAITVARRARSLNPDSRIMSIHGDIERVLGDSHFHDADVVLGCLDNAYARYLVNMRMRRVGKGWIDAGIDHDTAQVTILGPEGPCWACSMGERTIVQLRKRFSCTGFKATPRAANVPTTAVTASIVGALQTQLAASLISGRGAPMGRRWTLTMGGARWLDDELSVNGDCPFHARPRSRPRRRASVTAGNTFSDLARELGLSPRARLRLPMEVVVGLRCDGCRTETRTVCPMPWLPQGEAVCPSCGLVRTAQTITEVRVGETRSDMKLKQLGYVEGDWAEYMEGKRVSRVILGSSPVYEV